MTTLEYITQVRELEKSIKTAMAKIEHCNQAIDRYKKQLRDLDIKFQDDDVYKAVIVIKSYCENHECNKCPFYDQNPFVRNDCSFYKALPRNWRNYK